MKQKLKLRFTDYIPAIMLSCSYVMNLGMLFELNIFNYNKRGLFSYKRTLNSLLVNLNNL